MRKVRASVQERLGTLKTEITAEKASSVLRKTLDFEKELLFATAQGLRSVAGEVRKPLMVMIGHLSVVQVAFLGFCVAALVAGLLPWIQYTVVFQAEEVVNVGSSAKILFVLPALAGIGLSALNLPYRRKILLVLCAAAALGFIAGVIFPNPVHTSIVAGSFRLRYLAYAYVPFLALIAGLSERAFEKTTLPATEMLQSVLAADRPMPAGFAPARSRSGRAG